MMKKETILFVIALAFCTFSCEVVHMTPDFDDAKAGGGWPYFVYDTIHYGRDTSYLARRDYFYSTEDTAIIFFSFVSTKADFYLYLMPAVQGRAMADGKVISTTSNTNLMHLTGSRRDTISYYWPHGDIYLKFAIPANPDKEMREISFEYCYEVNNDNWTDWQFITAAIQEGTGY